MEGYQINDEDTMHEKHTGMMIDIDGYKADVLSQRVINLTWSYIYIEMSDSTIVYTGIRGS